MSFIVHPDYPDPLIAEQDIVCYKVGKGPCDEESFSLSTRTINIS